MTSPIPVKRQLRAKILDAEINSDNVFRVRYYPDATYPNLAPAIISGPINPAHHEFSMRRVAALQTGLVKTSPGLCREVDVENLMFVSGHSRDLSDMRRWPFTHQVEDVESALQHPYFFITSEMRTGKSKIVVDTAQYAFLENRIDRVIVIAPAPVRDVWFDPVIGEFSKHLFNRIPASIIEFHSRVRIWRWLDGRVQDPREPIAVGRRLEVIITNFEFLRSKARVGQLLAYCGPRTLLVGDESSFLKAHDSQQTISFLQLRKACGRVILLNGTPIFHSPLDLFSQGNILHPSILNCRFITYFKARYAIQEAVLGPGGKALKGPRGHEVQKVAGWTNLDDLQKRFAPVTVRRLQKDCLDLPPKLDPVTLTATLTPETWRIYNEMRQDLLVWLKSGEVSRSGSMAIRVMRLAQITSGFVGGIEDPGIDEIEDDLLASLELPPTAFDPDVVPFDAPVYEQPKATADYQIIGREKLDVLLWFIKQKLEADPNFHLVTWGRFRPEMFRILDEVAATFPHFNIGAIMGSQKREDRIRALDLLHPDTSPAGPTFVGGIEGTGSFGLNMTAAHTCVTISSGYSPGRSAQTLDRVYGPGQTEPIAYYNIVAVGPKNQKTIDHAVLAARLNGENIANWTAAAWVRAISLE
jgi:hypothetical protein